MIQTITIPEFPRNPQKEIPRILFENERTRIEAIVSPRGFSSPEGFFYDQGEDEFVVVATGEAELLFDEGNRTRLVKMMKGDTLYIPAHARHRVENIRYRTIWLAVFYKK